MAKNIRTKPTTSTIHEGTPIVVILYYLTFSRKIPIFLWVNAKKNKWHLTMCSTATSFPRFSPTRPWLGELLLKKVYLTMWWIHIFKWGPRVFKAEVKRGGGGGLGLQFGLKIRWGWGQGLPPPPPRPTPWSPNDITGPWTKKYELVACLSRDYCIKSETDWF